MCSASPALVGWLSQVVPSFPMCEFLGASPGRMLLDRTDEMSHICIIHTDQNRMH